MRVTCAQRFGPRSNLRSGPILAVVIHSLLRNPAKIGPEIRFSFRFALPAGMYLQSETKIEPDLRLS